MSLSWDDSDSAEELFLRKRVTCRLDTHHAFSELIKGKVLKELKPLIQYNKVIGLCVVTDQGTEYFKCETFIIPSIAEKYHLYNDELREAMVTQYGCRCIIF